MYMSEIHTDKESFAKDETPSPFDQEIAGLKEVFSLAVDGGSDKESEREFSDTLEGGNPREVSAWSAQAMGLDNDSIIAVEDRHSSYIFVDGEGGDHHYDATHVAVKSKKNGMRQGVFSHRPQWVDQVDQRDRQFTQEDRIKQQFPTTSVEDVEKSMIDKGLIGGEQDGDFKERVAQFVEELDAQPFLFGTIDELRKLLTDNLGDLANLIDLKRAQSGGGNLRQGAGVSLIVNFNGETGDIGSNLFSVSAENSGRALHPDGEAGVYELDLRKLRANMVRKSLELSGKTMLKGSFEEIKTQLGAMEVLESYYSNPENMFIEEVGDKIEIGYMGGFNNDRRTVQFTFDEKDGDQYTVDWSVFIRRKI